MHLLRVIRRRRYSNILFEYIHKISLYFWNKYISKLIFFTEPVDPQFPLHISFVSEIITKPTN